MYDDMLMSLEDILKISSIDYLEGENRMEAKELSNKDTAIVQTFTRAINYKKGFDLIPHTLEEMPLFTFLHTTYDNIVNEMPDLLTKKNHEDEFKTNHILALLKYIFQDSKNSLTLRCDIPSQAYRNTDKILFSIMRVDFTVYYRNIEIAAIEVKPLNVYDRSVEHDEVRLGELTKKLLHKRMATAKSKKEFSTFSMCFNGMYLLFGNV
ncbi:hypothetical protein INT48_006888 [Thamnidium elegans]|uniref:Uncharacterized protein n=1 Tax=Thamnidium elegans TaxID=101142 RepID=A0A8H7SLK3_9FUNG|nr:hypothetical protein INT48_006888 [Thamnidium elegans]